MSWYIGVDIYVKEENKDWKAEMISNYWLIAKALCSNRGTLDSTITPALLSDEDRKELEKLESQNNVAENDLVATVRKSDWEKIVDEPGFSHYTATNGSEVSFFVDDKSATIAKKYDVNSAEYLNAVADKKEKEFLHIYQRKIIPRGYGGNFYDANSFSAFAEKKYNELASLIAKKARWEKIKSSFRYLKLSDEEKENVDSAFEYLDEDIVDCRSKYEAAISMMNILDFYESKSETQAVAYMFGD